MPGKQFEFMNQGFADLTTDGIIVKNLSQK